tara:strand:- start:3178 stop:3378 length:201 start_codon:yes stop_codon:yes gene_type:complete
LRRVLDPGMEFVSEPVDQPYGKVAVFRDLYGNLWDLLEPAGWPGAVAASLCSAGRLRHALEMEGVS